MRGGEGVDVGDCRGCCEEVGEGGEGFVCGLFGGGGGAEGVEEVLDEEVGVLGTVWEKRGGC